GGERAAEGVGEVQQIGPVGGELSGVSGPGGNEISFAIEGDRVGVLRPLVQEPSITVIGRYVTVRVGDIYRAGSIQRDALCVSSPFGEKHARSVEFFNPRIERISDEDIAAGIHRDGKGTVELAVARSIRAEGQGGRRRLRLQARAGQCEIISV